MSSEYAPTIPTVNTNRNHALNLESHSSQDNRKQLLYSESHPDSLSFLLMVESTGFLEDRLSLTSKSRPKQCILYDGGKIGPVVILLIGDVAKTFQGSPHTQNFGSVSVAVSPTESQEGGNLAGDDPL